MILANDERWRRQPVFFQHGKRMVDEENRSRLAYVIRGAEADNTAFVFRLLVDPRPRRTIERHLVAVAGEKILTEVFAHLLEHEAQSADHRIVAKNSVLFLGDVLDEPEHE